MCKHAMNPAFYGYGHMSIDEEMYCADNILVAHYNMNQVVILRRYDQMEGVSELLGVFSELSFGSSMHEKGA